MKQYIEPACEALTLDLCKVLCGSFDQVDSTEMFYIDNLETI